MVALCRIDGSWRRWTSRTTRSTPRRQRRRSMTSLGPVVVVGHSAAGALLPAIAEAVGDRHARRRVRRRHAAAARVAAGSTPPHPGWRRNCAASPIAACCRPWHEWFPPGSLEALVPDPAAAATSRRRDSATAPGLLRRARAARTIRRIGGLCISAARRTLRSRRRQGRTARLVGGPQGLGSPADAQRPGCGRRPYRAGDFRDPIRVMAFWPCGTSL